MYFTILKNNFGKKSFVYFGNSMQFNKSTKYLARLFRKHSVHDVATSLFISSLWLPNISSAVKHQLLVAIFLSLKPTQFQNDDKIVNYQIFRAFLTRAYSYLPSFPGMEDYVPETDWGEVKFYHQEKNYKIFYGNELENVYDWLILYQVLYHLYDREYSEIFQRSPMEELQCTLRLQDAILSELHQSLPEDTLLEPGHIEIPSASFWEAGHNFYGNLNVSHLSSSEFIRDFSVQLGKFPREKLRAQEFINSVAEGRLLPYFFFSYKGRSYPILPRRYSSILIDAWGKLFQEFEKHVTEEAVPYWLKMGEELVAHISDHVHHDCFLPFVSAMTPQEKPHSVLFIASLLSVLPLLETNNCRSG